MIYAPRCDRCGTDIVSIEKEDGTIEGDSLYFAWFDVMNPGEQMICGSCFASDQRRRSYGASDGLSSTAPLS